ncbi:RIO1 family regulatory kinase/ATPase domain-containing protein [Candidatus Hodarchaeum mangrovi]
MPLKILDIFRDLNKFQFQLLSLIEVNMAYYEIVPVEMIATILKYSEKRTEVELRRLKRLKLIFIVQRHYLGVALTFMGYDALGLKALVEKGIIDQVGPEIGAGKESNIHLAINNEGMQFLIKIHRLGKLDFRATRKARSFIAEKRHLSPLYESRLSAQREYEALTNLYNAGISVPKPIAQNRHIVAMEIIIGTDLYRVKKNEYESQEQILNLFENILQEIRKATATGFIHGDLSEYNIRLDEKDYPVLFDWPQYIETSATHAKEALMRDIGNILKFFFRKFNLAYKIEVMDIVNELLNAPIEN